MHPSFVLWFCYITPKRKYSSRSAALLCSKEKMFLVSFQMELLFVGGVSEQNVSLTFDQPKENCYKIFNLRYTENICSSI